MVVVDSCLFLDERMLYFLTHRIFQKVSNISAFGLSCSHISSATSIGQHFHGRRKLFMLSLQSTAAAVGGMVYPYALAYLRYGFQHIIIMMFFMCRKILYKG